MSPQERFIVRGRLTDSAERPLADVDVFAIGKDLRHEIPLGRAKTGPAGRYEIAYTPASTVGDSRRPVNLLVRACDQAGTVLAESAVIFNAAPVETVDLMVDGARPSEFESALAAIRPLLDSVAITELTAADVSFLARVTNLPELNIAWLSVAHQYARAKNIPAEAFYGLFRQNRPTNLAALTLQNSRALRAALERSVDANIISGAIKPRIDEILSALRGLRGTSDAPADQASPWPALLRQAGLTPDQQQVVLSSYVDRTGTVGDFWAGLRRTELGPLVDNVQGVLRLGLITGNNEPLIAALRAVNVQSPQDLAQVGSDKLVQIISASDEILASVPPRDRTETRDARAARYARDILSTAGNAFPTAFLRARLAAPSSDPRRSEVARVLAAAPGFELRDRHLDQLLVDYPHAMDGVTDPDGAMTLLKQFQRVLRVVSAADHADALVSAGLDSARAIVGLAPRAFASQFGRILGGAGRAQACYARAQQVTAHVNALSLVARPANDILPYAIADTTAAKVM